MEWELENFNNANQNRHLKLYIRIEKMRKKGKDKKIKNTKKGESKQ